MPNNPDEVEFVNFLGIFILSSRRYWAWLTICLVLTLLLVVWFTRNWRIAIDPQAETCIDARILLIDLIDRKPIKGELYAFYSPTSASPVYRAGTRMIKRAAGEPGDVVLIDENETITINGELVGKGFFHLRTDDPAVRRKFYGERVVAAGHWWMMGDAPTSFDSRYWGSLPEENIYGRAYVLF